MTATKKTDMPGGNAADLAKHRVLWGHPLPRWGEDGMEFVHGSHWTEEIYDSLIMWGGVCKDHLQRFIHGEATHRKILTERLKISKACAAAKAESETYDDFAKRCDKILPNTILTSQESEAIEVTVQHAERCRKSLWTLSGATIKTPKTMTELADWTARQYDLLLRLSQTGLIPRPPEKILPKSMPKRAPSRQARLDAKPSTDPSGEDIF